MAFWLAAGTIAAGAAMALLGSAVARRYVRKARDDHSRRPALWNRFYGFDWGETTTNNYGFAPAEGSDPQRFQHQMYREMLRRLDERNPPDRTLRLLEVSCGRGGGLNAFLAAARHAFEATGLDVARTAIEACRKNYGQNERLRFVEGSALDLPFPDGSFDVVLNVEASNDYGDRQRFFREVARVLETGGVFLYADSFRKEQVERMRHELAEAGFDFEFDDISPNVAEACRIDSPRRKEVIRRHAPAAGRLLFSEQLENYAGIEGSNKHRAFVTGERAYLMTAAVKR